MAIFDFLGLKKTLSDVRSRLASLDAEITRLQERRSEVVRPPIPFDDFVDWVCEQVDGEAAGWPKAIAGAFNSTHLKEYLAPRGEGYDRSEDFQAGYPAAGGIKTPIFNIGRPSVPIGPDALFWCLRDQIKAGIRSAMESGMKRQWPSDVGLPRAKRIAELAKLDAEIDRLSQEREGIAAELASISAPA